MSGGGSLKVSDFSHELVEISRDSLPDIDVDDGIVMLVSIRVLVEDRRVGILSLDSDCGTGHEGNASERFHWGGVCF